MKTVLLTAASLFLLVNFGCAQQGGSISAQTQTTQWEQYYKSYPRFQELTDKLKTQKDLLILVDKTHALPDNYRPEKLVTVKTEFDTRTFKVTPQTAAALKKLMADAKKEKIKLYPISAYRTFEYQKKLYENSKKKNGLAHAERYSARPGRSQHNLGTAVDFNDVEVRFGNTIEYQWLKKNAGKYGFSISYPEGQEDITGYAYEPWHFRYIGKDAVELQDTFFNGSQQKMLEFLNEQVFNN